MNISSASVEFTSSSEGDPSSTNVVSAADTALSLQTPAVSVHGAYSPREVFTGYPVLTLPSAGSLPRSSRSSPVRSPRSSPSTSPKKRRVLQSRTALEGQPCIDQFFKMMISNHAASVSHSSSSPPAGQTFSSQIQSHSLSPNRKQARLDEVHLSASAPALSRNLKHFVAEPAASEDVQSSVGFENSCNNDTTVTSSNSDHISQSVSVDAMQESATVKNNAPSQSSMKISMSRLQKMRQIWEKTRASMCEKAVKKCALNDVTSEASVLPSSSVVCTKVNGFDSSNEAASISVCAVSDAVSVSTTVVSSQKSSSVIDSKLSDTTVGKQADNCGTENRPSLLDHGVKDNTVDDVIGVSASASKTDVSREMEHVCLAEQPNCKDNQTNMDNRTLEESDDCSYAPVESNHLFFIFKEVKTYLYLTYLF